MPTLSFSRQGPVLSPKLECRLVTLAYCHLHILGSSSPPVLACQVAGTTGVCHHELANFCISSREVVLLCRPSWS